MWGWAIEWVFFFLEITAALLYLYGWERLDSKTHEWFGWVYFVNAYLSLVVINGIITFMLTPGNWIKNHEFWSGIFNPTYFPSLALRTAIALALSGVLCADHSQAYERYRFEGTHHAMGCAVDCAVADGCARGGPVVHPSAFPPISGSA